MAVSKKPAAKKAVAVKKPAAKKAATPKKERYGTVQKFPNPTQYQIFDLRESIDEPKLLQHHAAQLIKSNLSTYQKWESGKVAMHPGLWELLQIKISQLVAGKIEHPAYSDKPVLAKKTAIKKTAAKKR